MNILGCIQQKKYDLRIHQNQSKWCSISTVVKVGAVVLGLLLIGMSIAMYFSNVNAIAAYVTGGIGGATTIAIAIWSIIDCMPIVLKELTRKVTIKLTKMEGSPNVTEEEVAELLKNHPHAKRLVLNLRIHRVDSNWNPDFTALETLFTKNADKSNGICYVYDRKKIV